MFTTNGQTGVWKQYQPGKPRHHYVRGSTLPVGRWSFTMAPCGSGALMAAGSIGYRILNDDTWSFNFTYFPSKWSSKTVNHDAWGEWNEDKSDNVVIPQLGGVTMARISDGDLKGVIMFGGV